MLGPAGPGLNRDCPDGKRLAQPGMLEAAGSGCRAIV